MRLWTVQTPEVYEAVMREGVLVSDPQKSKLLCGDDGRLDYTFLTAYSWMAVEMDKRIKRPECYKLLHPWWAYRQLGGRDTLSLSDIDCLDSPGDTMVAMELEVPDEEVVLSDLDLWHYVLNDTWIDGSLTEEEYVKNLEEFKNLSKKEARHKKIESWQNIFDLTQVETDWYSHGFDIQATFWLLKKDYIVSTQEFVVRDIGAED